MTGLNFVIFAVEFLIFSPFYISLRFSFVPLKEDRVKTIWSWAFTVKLRLEGGIFWSHGWFACLWFDPIHWSTLKKKSQLKVSDGCKRRWKYSWSESWSRADISSGGNHTAAIVFLQPQKKEQNNKDERLSVTHRSSAISPSILQHRCKRFILSSLTGV